MERRLNRPTHVQAAPGRVPHEFDLRVRRRDPLRAVAQRRVGDLALAHPHALGLEGGAGHVLRQHHLASRERRGGHRDQASGRRARDRGAGRGHALVATAAVAVPIAAAVWIVTGQIIQAQDVKPEIAEVGKRLEDAHRLEHLLPDITTAFRGLAFAGTETEAERRFKQWMSYIENLRPKVIRFFAEE